MYPTCRLSPPLPPLGAVTPRRRTGRAVSLSAAVTEPGRARCRWARRRAGDPEAAVRCRVARSCGDLSQDRLLQV